MKFHLDETVKCGLLVPRVEWMVGWTTTRKFDGYDIFKYFGDSAYLNQIIQHKLRYKT